MYDFAGLHRQRFSMKQKCNPLNAFNFKKALLALDWKERVIFSQNLLKWLLTLKT